MLVSSASQELERSYFQRQEINPRLVADLVMESGAQKQLSERVSSNTCSLANDGSVNGRGNCLVAGPGPVLKNFQSTAGLELASDFADEYEDLYPARASYLFYEKNDYSFFHHDVAHAHITIILGLSQGLLPLILFPSFGPVSEHDVKKLNAIDDLGPDPFKSEMNARFGIRARACEIEMRKGHAIAIPGRHIPHARPQQSVEASVCTVCYSLVTPEKRWRTLVN